MKTIPLTRGLFAMVDDKDYQQLNQWKWRAQRAHKGSCKFYAARWGPTVMGKRNHIWMHNVIGGCVGQDHVDGNGLNNQRSNLRPASHAQNCRNKPIQQDNRSGYKGVCWKKANRKWCAQISKRGASTHLGLFDDPKLAAEAYDRAAMTEYGEFAKTNAMLGAFHA